MTRDTIVFEVAKQLYGFNRAPLGHNENPCTSVTSQSNNLTIGQHIIVYWDVEDSHEWYLGLVETLIKGEIFYSQFERAKPDDDCTWISTGDEVQKVEMGQILAMNVNVSYPISVRRVMCIMDLQEVASIKQLLCDIH